MNLSILISLRFACFLPPKLWLFFCFPFFACQCWESATGLNVCAGRPCFAHTVVNLILSIFELVVNLNCKLSIYLTYGMCNKALYLLRLLTTQVAFCTYCKTLFDIGTSSVCAWILTSTLWIYKSAWCRLLSVLSVMSFERKKLELLIRKKNVDLG